MFVLRFRDAVNKQKDALLSMGYPSFTLEDFHDTVSPPPSSSPALDRRFSVLCSSVCRCTGPDRKAKHHCRELDKGSRMVSIGKTILTQ